MQKFFVTIGRLEHDDNTSWVEGEITLAVYGEDSSTVYDTMRLLYPGFEVGYPTEEEPVPKPVELDENTCNQEVHEKGVLVEVCDLPKYKADARCKRLTEETGLLHDWHYFGGRVVIKRLNK